MKTSLVLFIKVCLFVYVLTLTPFFTTLFAYFGVDENGITSSIYTYEIKDALSIKDTLNHIESVAGSFYLKCYLLLRKYNI